MEARVLGSCGVAPGLIADLQPIVTPTRLCHSGRKDALAHRHVRPITGIIGRVGRLRGGYALPTLGRSGKLSWCSNGLTGAEVQVRLAMGVRGELLETDPRGELLDRAELAVCLNIIGATHHPHDLARSHNFPALSAAFDDPNLVSYAGLAPVLALAARWDRLIWSPST